MSHHAVIDADDLARADERLALLATHRRAKAGTILDYAASAVRARNRTEATAESRSSTPVRTRSRVPFPGWRSSDSVSLRSDGRAT